MSIFGNTHLALSENWRAKLLRVAGLNLGSIALAACGINNNGVSTGPSFAAGGNGGASSSSATAFRTGGAQALGVGGTASSGGTTSNVALTGGAATGGATKDNSLGGSSTGGSVFSSGGALRTGGTRSTATGGNVSTGGNTPTGGSSNLGIGGQSTGGAATGGSKPTGGAASGGSATGGLSSTSSCTPSSTKFSFFVTSQTRLFALAQAFNGSTKGFGGDLRYGQSTGLAGADKICTAIAEASSPGNCKTWRAFLSVADDGSGKQVNAISRIGSGPWYDRLGRLFGTNITTINATRPDAASAIVNDFPNEDGVLNHDALQTGNTANQDNHDMLTGSTATGTLFGANAHCTNWTSSASDTSKKPRVGHSWPAMSGQSWMSALDESGCAPGANLVDRGGPGSDGTVGSGGGYGGFYCFALTP